MLTSVVKETLQDKIAELPKLDLIWATGITPFSADEAAADVLGDLLAEGHASRLYKRLVHDEQVASSVEAGSMTLGLGGYYQISAVAKGSKTAADQLEGLQTVIDEIKKNGPTATEVERVKRRIVANRLRAIERIGGFGGKADILNSYQTSLGDPGFLPKDLARYRAVTPEEVKAFANKYLRDDRRIELTTVPAPKTTASN
jgi:predicted Zn-dependent peptidase